MHKVFIDGQAGTTGLKIHQYLESRTEFELLEIDDAQRKNAGAKREIIREADVVILCLPDDAAIETVKLAADTEARILDASSAHRVHSEWIYGLPELSSGQRRKIASAQFVANPGCYPTGYLLAVRPLVEAGIIPKSLQLSISALSGYTGGGRQMVERYEAQSESHPEALWYARPYALNMAHKHLPEMQRYSGLSRHPLFMPMVGHFPQGMLVSVPLALDDLRGARTANDITEALQDAYLDESCITVHDANDQSQLENGQLSPLGNTNTNRVDLFVFGGESQAIVIARLDNLGKGAGGAAVQNLNLMLGQKELSGVSV